MTSGGSVAARHCAAGMPVADAEGRRTAAATCATHSDTERRLPRNDGVRARVRPLLCRGRGRWLNATRASCRSPAAPTQLQRALETTADAEAQRCVRGGTDFGAVAALAVQDEVVPCRRHRPLRQLAPSHLGAPLRPSGHADKIMRQASGPVCGCAAQRCGNKRQRREGCCSCRRRSRCERSARRCSQAHYATVV